MADFRFVTPSTRFMCKRCTQCCSLDVMLSDEEMARLGDSCDREWHTTKKASWGSDMPCCLLRGRSCSIYESRPRLCRIYPFFAIPESEMSMFGILVEASASRFSGEDGEHYIIIYDEKCPGIGEGGECNFDWQAIVTITVDHKNDFRAASNATISGTQNDLLK